jgi:glutamine synthetase
MKDGLPKLDGSSIVGFTSIDDSDLLLKPDPNTFAIIPWMTENKTARLLCDVYWGEDRGRLSRDPISKPRDLILVLGVQRWNSLFLIRYIGMF